MAENYNDGYYHFGADLELYPDATVYVIWSLRGPGKTYSCLRYAYEHNIPIVYMKRTKHDIETLTRIGANGEDQSPYAPLNRDFGYNIKPYSSKDYMAFYNFEVNEDGKEIPVGAPVAYVLALSQIKDVKGFELSHVDWIVFDEFIPLPGEIIRIAEGEMLLSVYDSIVRDRVTRGKAPTKLILMANSESVTTPITREMELIDTLVEVTQMDEPIHRLIDTERGGLYHHISKDECPAMKVQDNVGMRKFMKGTAYAAKAYEGQFIHNDFSNVKKHINLKNCKPYVHLTYRGHHYYIYMHTESGVLKMCGAQAKCLFDYDLNKDNDQKRYWIEHGIDIYATCIENKMEFAKYSMYDLIANYKKYFSV